MQKNLNALIVLILSGILLGAFGVQIFLHEQPCPLCMLQRLGMLGVAVGALLNIWFGVRTTHYGLMLLSSVVGGLIALRQIAFHICPGFAAFGTPIFGISLYMWSFIIFSSVVLAVALLLFLYDQKKNGDQAESVNLFCKFASIVIFLVASANVVTTYMQCGLTPCVGF